MNPQCKSIASSGFGFCQLCCLLERGITDLTMISLFVIAPLLRTVGTFNHPQMELSFWIPRCAIGAFVGLRVSLFTGIRSIYKVIVLYLAADPSRYYFSNIALIFRNGSTSQKPRKNCKARQ
jgi:hypothetical protein